MFGITSLGPLMANTGSEPEDEAVPDRVKGYIRDGQGWKLNTGQQLENKSRQGYRAGSRPDGGRFSRKVT